MSTVTKSRFGQVVSAKLIANKVAGRKPDSLRGLAKLMARGDIEKAATFKRSLNKWSAAIGPKPSPSSRALVAHHLEIDASELDDEEADPVALMAALMKSVSDASAKQAVAEYIAQTKAATS